MHQFRKTNFHLFCFPPALEDKDVGIDVLHTDPVRQAKSGVCPHPVHHGPQLGQERNQPEPVGGEQPIRETH